MVRGQLSGDNFPREQLPRSNFHWGQLFVGQLSWLKFSFGAVILGGNCPRGQ